LIEQLVVERSEFVREEGLHAVGPLMGVLMKDLRGKMSGEEVSRMLRENRGTPQPVKNPAHGALSIVIM